MRPCGWLLTSETLLSPACVCQPFVNGAHDGVEKRYFQPISILAPAPIAQSDAKFLGTLIIMTRHWRLGFRSCLHHEFMVMGGNTPPVRRSLLESLGGLADRLVQHMGEPSVEARGGHRKRVWRAAQRARRKYDLSPPWRKRHLGGA